MKTSEFRIYRLLGFMEGLSKSQLMAIAVGTVLILGVIDYFTGTEFSLSFFYLFPVAIMAWARSKNSGLAFSVLCASVWLTTNLLAGQVFTSPFIEVWNTLIRFGFFATVAVLLAELRHALEEERILANTDPLTGALNRRSFNDIVDKKMITAEVNRRPYTMVYIDLDNFKTVNDRLGHAVGDLVLKLVVDTIQTYIRNTDFLARLGGDEFIMGIKERADIEIQEVTPDNRDSLSTGFLPHIRSISLRSCLSSGFVFLYVPSCCRI